MGLTTDRNSECLKKIKPDGQQACYLVLSEEERAKGFIRPVRTNYIHVGKRPKYPTRQLTEEEHKIYDDHGFVVFEVYPEGERSTGRFWTQKELDSGCGGETKMGYAIAETYARNPKFYSGTFCVHCIEHFDVGENGEFVWEDGSRVGT